MAHVSGVYQKQVANFLSTEMINLLQQYYNILNAEVRMTLVTCLKIMRTKDCVPSTVVLPVFLKLFRCKDKELRKFLHGVIIGDLKQLNFNTKNHAINRKLQNFILSLLQDPNEDAAKRSLSVMIELYKRRVWNDDKTVNAIWTGGLLHSNPKIVAVAARFFLVLDYDFESESSSSDDEPDA
jgi:protein SDA1